MLNIKSLYRNTLNKGKLMLNLTLNGRQFRDEMCPAQIEFPNVKSIRKEKEKEKRKRKKKKKRRRKKRRKKEKKMMKKSSLMLS